MFVVRGVGDIGVSTKTPCYYLGPIVPQKGQSIKIVCLGQKHNLLRFNGSHNLTRTNHILYIFTSKANITNLVLLVIFQTVLY